MSWSLFCSCFLLCRSEEGSLLTGPCRNSLCCLCASGFLQGRRQAYQGKMKLPVTQGGDASTAGPDHVALWQFIDSYNQQWCVQPPLAVWERCTDSSYDFTFPCSLLFPFTMFFFPSVFRYVYFFI